MTINELKSQNKTTPYHTRKELEVIEETLKNVYHECDKENAKSITRNKTELDSASDKFKSGFKYALYKDMDNPNKYILAFAGTDANIFKHGVADYYNDVQMKFHFAPIQFMDALKTYIAVKEKLGNDVKITLVGHSLGGSLVQLVCAVTGAIGITFNPYETRDILRDSFISRFIANPDKDFTNITNYKTSHDLLYVGFEHFDSSKNLGTTYIIKDDKIGVNSHNNFEQFAMGEKIPAKEFEKTINITILKSCMQNPTLFYKNAMHQYASFINKYDSATKSKLKGTMTGGASSVENTKKNFTPAEISAGEIDDDKWDDNDIAFLEGFHERDKDKHLITEAKERRKQRIKEKGNKGVGPNGENGYWYTTKKGKHVFVEEEKVC